MEKLKKDLQIMRILRTNEIRYHIGKLDRGQSLDLAINKEEKYQFFVDASPLEKEENDQMLKIYGLQ